LVFSLKTFPQLIFFFINLFVIELIYTYFFNFKKLTPSITPKTNKNCEITKILSELINVENKKFYIRNSRCGISVEFMFKRKLDDFLDKSTTNLLNLYKKFEVIEVILNNFFGPYMKINNL